MVLTIIGLLAGFFVLLKSADYLVDSASSIAKRYGISPLFIGLTIVAFGSSAPELIVNIFAAIEGASEIALGNVMGSNIALATGAMADLTSHDLADIGSVMNAVGPFRELRRMA